MGLWVGGVAGQFSNRATTPLHVPRVSWPARPPELI